MSEESDSVFLFHEACPECGSSDALARYSDGHAHCFACQHYEHADGEVKSQPTKRMSKEFAAITGETKALTARGLTEETCQKWGYMVGEYRGSKVQVANYRNRDGELVGQKVRFKNKEFAALGKVQGTLFGSHLWRDAGKKIVITEGEIDAMTVSQVQGHKWPVVSIPTGADGAVGSIRKNIDWLSQFEEVVFMFDNDKPGIEAAKECAAVLPPGKAKIASLSLKDPNEMLQAGKGAEIINAIWGAKSFRPDGIVAGNELWGTITTYDDNSTSVPYPWKGLTALTLGLRRGELVTVTAGSGIGKSAVCRELGHSLLVTHGESVGYIALEESVRRTALGILSVEMSQPLHLMGKDQIDEAKLKVAYEKSVGNGKFFTYDHFGSMDSENLMNRIRFMVQALGCKWIILDHISIVVSGLGDGDERRIIDNAMTMLRSLVEELKIGLILVSHLKRPEGKGHEEGAATSMSQLRGSAAIGQLSDIVLGLERDQQDADNKNLTLIRVLKNRFTGETGLATALRYNNETGRLTEEALPQEGENPFPDDGNGETKDF